MYRSLAAVLSFGIAVRCGHVLLSNLYKNLGVELEWIIVKLCKKKVRAKNGELLETSVVQCRRPLLSTPVATKTHTHATFGLKKN